jgi:polyphenol oxidase
VPDAPRKALTETPPGISRVLTSPLLSKHGFAHGFSPRTEEPGDLMRTLLAPRTLYQANQVHGAAVLRGEGDVAALRLRSADALVARAPFAVGVRVADCVPVLVGALETGSVAAIHAGWRGVVLGVVPAALAELANDGGARRVVAIGPCIGPCCFEVGGDVADQIAAASHGADVVVRRAGEKAYVDLRAAVRAQLAALGVAADDVEDVPGCTKCDAARFFSFRRDGANAGRHLAAIAGR